MLKDHPLEAYNMLKNLFIQKGDVNFVDMGKVMLTEAELRGWTYQEAFTLTAKDSLNSFTSDGVHLQDFGSKVYADYLVSIFNLV